MRVPFNEALFSKFGLKGGDKILEIACGFSLDFGIPSALKGYKYVGIDTDMLLLEDQKLTAKYYVRKLTGIKGNPLFIRMDASEIGIKKDSFDLIVCHNFSSLLNRNEHQKFINDILKILKIDGMLLLSPFGINVANRFDIRDITVEYIIGLAKNEGAILSLVEKNIDLRSNFHSADLFKLIKKV
ncbi:MAG: class I SAM-dependent methyltransferase [Candidatus Saganbacteria bacterium]|nr:class I SAM-dependent methyltransferase [Candidatus Saganbacteria bacterium]